MKQILMLVLLVAASWAQSKPSKGVYDGITITVDSAEYSKNGKLVVLKAHETNTDNGFVLGCPTDESDCIFPKVGAPYRVVSVMNKNQESWGLVLSEGKGKLGIFRLLYAESK